MAVKLILAWCGSGTGWSLSSLDFFQAVMFDVENFVTGCVLVETSGVWNCLNQPWSTLAALVTFSATFSCSEPFVLMQNLRVQRSGWWLTDDVPVTLMLRGAMVKEMQFQCRN